MIWSGTTRSRYSSNDGSTEMKSESIPDPEYDDTLHNQRDQLKSAGMIAHDDSEVAAVSAEVVEVVDREVLHKAVAATQYGRLDELTQMLDRGVITPNTRDSDGCTLLQWAAINNRKDIVAELLARGARPNEKGGFLQETALQWAVRQGALESVIELVHHDIDPFSTGSEGMNALHLACVFKHVEIVMYLCSVYPSLTDRPTDKSKGGQTPIMVLINHYVKPRATTETLEKAKNILRALLSLGASVNAQAQPSGDTAMHFAARLSAPNHSRTLFQILLREGANAWIDNERGQSAFKECMDAQKRDLARVITDNSMERRVPGVLGFWAPWGQIVAMAGFTQWLGWMIGCVYFLFACGALNVVGGITAKTRLRIQHGFASGSIFFIILSAYIYLFDSCSPIFIAWYVYCIISLVYYFVKTTITDPGFVPIPGRDQPHPKSNDETVEMLEQGLRDAPSSPQELIIKLAENGELFDSQICSTCLVQRPPRSKHDPVLGRCVRRFDHYCPFVNTVVGEKNIAPFMGFLIWCVLGIGSHLSIALPFIWAACPDAEPVADPNSLPVQPVDHEPESIGFADHLHCAMGHTPPAFTVVTILALVHILWISGLMMGQISQIMSDITTYEAIRGYRSRPQSWKQGIKNFFDVMAQRPTIGPLSPMGTAYSH